MARERDLFLVTRHASVRDRQRSMLLALVERVIRALSHDDFYTRSRAVAADLARSVDVARRATADLTWAYLDAALTEVGEEPSPGSLRHTDEPRGISPDEVWDRPLKQYRLAVSVGESRDVAVDKAVNRALSITRSDLDLGVRDAAAQHSRATPHVTGLRRVIHPELSRGGTCGLCVAASDRIYRPGLLMPIHDGCFCTVAEVTRRTDPGSGVNGIALGDLYEAAGSTDAAALKRTRYKIVEHGELGLVLASAGSSPRTAEDVKRDTGVALDGTERARLRAVALQRSVDALEARAAAGEDVSVELDYQRRLLRRERARAA